MASAAHAQAPQPPEIAARAYLLLDVSAQQVLAAKDADSPVEPASLTKLMTAYLVFDALKSGKISLEQKFAVSERAWKMPGSRMFIDPKMQVPVEDLIKGMVVQSGNDATVALAEGVGGDVAHFVQMMNAQAQVLGMKSTGYKTRGLTEAGHTTTARDLATLATRLMADFPQYTGYYAIKKYRYPGTPAANDSNRNLLLQRDPSVDGLKQATPRRRAIAWLLRRGAITLAWAPKAAIRAGACCPSCWVRPMKTRAPTSRKSC